MKEPPFVRRQTTGKKHRKFRANLRIEKSFQVVGPMIARKIQRASEESGALGLMLLFETPTFTMRCAL
jgi:hypothetical protein